MVLDGQRMGDERDWVLVGFFVTCSSSAEKRFIRPAKQDEMGLCVSYYHYSMAHCSKGVTGRRRERASAFTLRACPHHNSPPFASQFATMVKSTSARLIGITAIVSLLTIRSADAFVQRIGISRTDLVSVKSADASQLSGPFVERPWSYSQSNSQRSMYIGDDKNKSDGSDDGEDDNVMSSNRLSHMMLRVPDVAKTVDYWVDKGATVKQRNKSPAGGETAFVALGNGKDDQLDSCFALEISSLPADETLEKGDGLAYLGTSMLLDFQNNLIGAAAGEKIAKDGEDAVEPNDIEVRRVASGPGDYFARLCLRPKPLDKDAVNGEDGGNLSPLEITEQFYTDVLGMRVVANDSDLLCLRYKDSGFGVSTMLVFTTEGESNEELIMGNMLDHLVIGTPSVEAAAETLKATEQGKEAIFLEPTAMFGTTILGVKDPNDYTIYLAEESLSHA